MFNIRWACWTLQYQETVKSPWRKFYSQKTSALLRLTRYLPTDGRSLCLVSTALALQPKYEQDHWAFSFLLLIGILERTTLPSRNHKQIPLVLTGGRLCSWVMPMESRIDLFEVRMKGVTAEGKTNKVKAHTISYFFGEFWWRMFKI